MTEKITAGIFLAFVGWEDSRGKTVSVRKILLFFAGSLICTALKIKEVPGELWDVSRDVMLGSLPGISLLLCGKLSGWAVGSADGIIVLVLGIYLGFWQVLSVLSGAFLTAVMAAGFLLAVKKKDRKYEIPFIPFLFAGMMFSIITG